MPNIFFYLVILCVTYCRIGHDNKGFLGGAWYLDRVHVHSESVGKNWSFVHGRWLAKNEDDGKLERMLDNPVVIPADNEVAVVTPVVNEVSGSSQVAQAADGGSKQGRQSVTFVTGIPLITDLACILIENKTGRRLIWLDLTPNVLQFQNVD